MTYASKVVKMRENCLVVGIYIFRIVLLKFLSVVNWGPWLPVAPPPDYAHGAIMLYPVDPCVRPETVST